MEPNMLKIKVYQLVLATIPPPKFSISDSKKTNEKSKAKKMLKVEI